MATVRPIAVLDTNVLFGNVERKKLQTAAMRGVYTAVWCPWITAELNRVLTWRWAKQRGTTDVIEDEMSRRAKTMMTLLLDVMHCVHAEPPYAEAWPSLRDPDDEPIWATAITAGADYVVTNNTRDSPLPSPDGRRTWQGIEYITYTRFLEILGIDDDD